MLSPCKNLTQIWPSWSTELWLGRHWDDTWRGCLPCHPSNRVLSCGRKVVTVCCSLAHWLGFKRQLPSSSGLVSPCFEANVEQDLELAWKTKSPYGMESFRAYKQDDPRFAADARAHEILERTDFNNSKRCDVSMLWAHDNNQLPINSFRHCTAYGLNLSKSGSRETQHWRNLTLRPSVKTWKRLPNYRPSSGQTAVVG